MARQRQSKGDRPAVCVQCAELIDLTALHLAMAQKAEYVHQCGRVLWKANG